MPQWSSGLRLTSAGHVTDEIPALDEVGLLALQPDDALICPLLEGLVLVKSLLGLLQTEMKLGMTFTHESKPGFMHLKKNGLHGRVARTKEY